MPVPTLSIDATITERGQTTVPAAIRKMLGVTKGAVTFKGMSDGSVLIVRKEESHEDPAIGAFLTLLADDIANGNILPLDSSLIEEVDDLVEGVAVDMDAPLADE